LPEFSATKSCEVAFETKQQVEVCYECLRNIFCTAENDSFPGWSSQGSKMAAGILLSATGFFLLLNKRFKKHPYPLIAFAFLTEAMFYV